MKKLQTGRFQGYLEGVFLTTTFVMKSPADYERKKCENRKKTRQGNRQHEWGEGYVGDGKANWGVGNCCDYLEGGMGGVAGARPGTFGPPILPRR